MKFHRFLPVFAIIALTSSNIWADSKPVYEIKIKEHRFYPAELEIPAGKKVKLIIHNEDPTPEEFESYDLNREKIISGNAKGIIFVGPLKPGSYEYFGEFNQDTATGVIRAIEL